MTEASAPAPQVNNVTREITDRRKVVIDKLTALQDAHRLAIHMVETQNCPVAYEPSLPESISELELPHPDTLLQFSSVSKPSPTILESLSHTKCQNIPQSLQLADPRLFSLSLLPSTDSHLSMQPYEVKYGIINNYGYLIDLSQQQSSSSPRVVQISPYNLGSQNDLDNKLFFISRFSRAMSCSRSFEPVSG